MIKIIFKNMYIFKTIEKGAINVKKTYLPAQAGGNVYVSCHEQNE